MGVGVRFVYMSWALWAVRRNPWVNKLAYATALWGLSTEDLAHVVSA